MPDVIVVGAGLFGSTIARALVRKGLDVVVYDDARPLAGSAPSGCLMKPSWYSGLAPGVYDQAIRQLDDLYGVRCLKFKLWPTKALVDVKWVPREQILDRANMTVRPYKVTMLSGKGVRSVRKDGIPGDEEARIAVIVATGFWANELLGEHIPPIRGKRGASVMWDGASLPANFIRPYAPYKQMVAFQETPDRVWAGDGTAIVTERWDPRRARASVGRLSEVTRLAARSARVVEGVRPYVKGAAPCYLSEVSQGLWVATGGAKAGCLGAGWAAAQLAGRLT